MAPNTARVFGANGNFVVASRSLFFFCFDVSESVRNLLEGCGCGISSVASASTTNTEANANDCECLCVCVCVKSFIRSDMIGLDSTRIQLPALIGRRLFPVRVLN